MKIFLISGLILLGCSSSDHGSGSHHFMDEIREHRDSIAYPVMDNEFFDEIKKVQAQLSDEQLKIYVPQRTNDIKSFPCTNCHNQPLSDFQLQEKNEKKKAHWDIELYHANQEVMDCATCHDDPDSDELVMLSGSSISFDHSYKVCGQCHSTQIKDWIGGAHGKRLAGWKPPRLINTCVNCHNPHKPAFETRWPARFNTEKIRQTEE